MILLGMSNKKDIIIKKVALSGFCVYIHGMKALIPHDIKLKIAEKLIHGESPERIAKEYNISVNHVLSLLGEREFSAKLLELFKNRARGVAVIAHNNIMRIAFDEKATAATQLKASKILVDIARELEEIHANDLEPANMTQNQLSDRLKALQKEAIARAKPINTDIIDVDSMT